SSTRRGWPDCRPVVVMSMRWPRDRARSIRSSMELHDAAWDAQLLLMSQQILHDRRPASRSMNRTDVLSFRDEARVPRGAVPNGPEPRDRNVVPLVAQSVHGLRAPLHVLLRSR